MASHNCAKNFHACQWERDIFLILLVLLVIFNVAQVVYFNRAKIYRVLRRAANEIPAEDQEPIMDN